MLTDKIKETLKILVGTLFLVAAVWQATLPVEEEKIFALIDLIFALIGTIIGGPAAVRTVLGKKLVDK